MKKLYQAFTEIFTVKFWAVFLFACLFALLLENVFSVPLPESVEKSFIAVCAVLALDCVRNATTSYVEKNDLEKCFIDKFQSAVENAKQKPLLRFLMKTDYSIAFGTWERHYEIRRNCKGRGKFEIRLDFESKDEQANERDAVEIAKQLGLTNKIEKSQGTGEWRRLVLYRLDKNAGEDICVADAVERFIEWYDKTHERFLKGEN